MNQEISKNKTIFVAGNRGMVGSAIVRHLQHEGFDNIITRSHTELDLTDQSAVKVFFTQNRIDYVVLAAAKVGGIFANNEYPADFIYQNLMIECNVIHQAYTAGIKKLLFLGSSCIYPKHVEQPMREDALLGGTLEPTNEPYAIAKISGIKLCESYNRQYGTDYRSIMPTNLYGPNDNYHGLNSHVIPAMIKKFHQAKVDKAPFVEIWGTGKVRREFLHVDDMADASLFVMQLAQEIYQAHTKPMLSHLNIGSGEDVTISELARTIKEVTGYTGELHFDTSKPDGTPRKLLDVSLLAELGWRARIPLKEGLEYTYKDYAAKLDS